MKSSFNKNVLFSCSFIILFLILNQYTWLLYFDEDGLLPIWVRLFLGIVDLFLIISAILFYLNRYINSFPLRYFKLILFNLILLIFSLFIIESVFGSWFNPSKLNQLNIIRDRIINYNLNGLYPWSRDNIVYTRDKWGFRGNYPNVDNIDILTIGGSTTDQRYISDGYTFQDVLQSEFKKNGKDVYVVNGGVDGQSTFGHIKNFDWWFPNIPNLNVKYLLFYIGVNDFYKDKNYPFDDLRGESTNKIKNIIKSRSALFYLYRTIEGIWLAHVFGLRHNTAHKSAKFSSKTWVNQPMLSNYEEIMKDRLYDFEQRLNILFEKVKNFGSIPIFVSQSERGIYDFIDQQLYGKPNALKNYDGYKGNGVDYYNMIQLLHERTKKICERNGVMFINLDQELKFDINHDFYDGAHNTPSGAEKIGKYLFKNLKHLF